MAEPRPYRSPLRQEQARRTAELILDALVDLVSEQGAAELSIRDLASRAGVSERTVYRHFPDRTALLDGLMEHVGTQAGWPVAGDVARSVDDIADLAPRYFAGYDAHEREARAMVLLNLDPARTATDTTRNQTLVRDLLHDRYPALAEDELAMAAAVVHLLVSSRTWLRFRDQAGLTGEQAGRASQWATRLVLDDLARRDPTDPV